MHHHKKRHPHARHDNHMGGRGGHGARGGHGGRGRGRGGHGRRSEGPRVMRGDIRIAILHLLDESPMHGYQLMQEIEDRSEGRWQPSPGSIYPNLSQLADEGLISSAPESGKNIFSLTVNGTAAVRALTEPAPWERFAEEDASDPRGLHSAMRGLIAAIQQVASNGSAEQRDAATNIIDQTRKSLYLLLAD